MSVDLTALLTSVTEVARTAFGATTSSLVVLVGDELVFRGVSGVGADVLIGTRMPREEGILGRAAATRQTLVVTGAVREPGYSHGTAARAGYSPDVILAAPIVHEGEVLGTLAVLDPTRTATDHQRGVDLLERLADHAALVLAAFDG
ncbi:MAG TPA: GAF domain-containing protein [Acidimicrobiales bacterium]|nr:GAF domain-containing protein [Acidimicrobiales bacterium]